MFEYYQKSVLITYVTYVMVHIKLVE